MREMAGWAAGAGWMLAAAGCALGEPPAGADPGAEAGVTLSADTTWVADEGWMRGAAVVLSVADEGNEVRYRVRERLAGRALPGDAVGETSDVTGAIALDAAGQVIPALSMMVVDVTRLRSGVERRDGYVRSRVLETEEHPTVDLRPTALRGISAPLPASGARTLELLTDLTVRGVTRPTTWRVEARFEPGRIAGRASTRFTFADFGLARPSVPAVASVDDTIRLEYDFALVRTSQVDY